MPLDSSIIEPLKIQPAASPEQAPACIILLFISIFAELKVDCNGRDQSGPNRKQSANKKKKGIQYYIAYKTPHSRESTIRCVVYGLRLTVNETSHKIIQIPTMFCFLFFCGRIWVKIKIHIYNTNTIQYNNTIVYWIQHGNATAIWIMHFLFPRWHFNIYIFWARRQQTHREKERETEKKWQKNPQFMLIKIYSVWCISANDDGIINVPVQDETRKIKKKKKKKKELIAIA